MLDFKSFNIYGNTPLASAEVICIVDAPSVQESNAILINEIWDNHLVLVGAIPSGKKIKVSKFDSFKGLKCVKHVFGWDILDSRRDHFEQSYLQIEQFEQKFLLNIQFKKWTFFSHYTSPFYEFLEVIFPDNNAREIEIKCTLELLSKKQFDLFSSRVKKLIVLAKVLHDEQCSKTYEETFQQRNESLLRSMEEASKQGKTKLIVLIEQKQFQQLDKIPELKTRKFVVICSSQIPSPFPENIPSLWSNTEPELAQAAAAPEIEKQEALTTSEPFSPAYQLRQQLETISPLEVVPTPLEVGSGQPDALSSIRRTKKLHDFSLFG